jgi:peptide/nickel transport system permease protein
MLRLILRRLITVVPTLLIVTFGTFMLVKLSPTDPAVSIAGGVTATKADIEQAREQYNLNDSTVSQYWSWLKDAAQLDFGTSYIRKTSVSEELKARIPVTLSLIFAAVVFALILAIPLGIVSGLRPNGPVDHGSRVLSSLAAAIPNFLIALILVYVFAVDLKWLPTSGYVKFSDDPREWLRFIVLPAVSLGFLISAAFQRQLRGALIDVLDQNYIRTRWAVGDPLRRVVGRHGMKNAVSPAITILGIQIGALAGGAVIIEQIFSIPGIGPYLLQGITSGDIPIIQACVLVAATIQIGMSFVVDVTYAFLNPKIRVSA